VVNDGGDDDDDDNNDNNNELLLTLFCVTCKRITLHTGISFVLSLCTLHCY
jgi:hypothetical protein